MISTLKVTQIYLHHLFFFLSRRIILWIELQFWRHLCVMWIDGSVVEFQLCVLCSQVQCPVVEITVYTTDET